MADRTVVCDVAGLSDTSWPEGGVKRLRSSEQLLFVGWSGLVAGLLEVATIVLRKVLVDPNQLYGMSRHFRWLIPVTNLCIFLGVAVCGWIMCWVWPQTGRWIGRRFFCGLTLLPTLLVAFPRIYGLAGFFFTLGIATRLVPRLEQHHRSVQRLVQVSLPLVIAIVFILATVPVAGDWIKERRVNTQTLPPPGSPNLLLIVLDTVAAGHLSLGGYERSTSTTLLEVAERGIRFDAARAASSWTLPSHATMFTGRWLHELSVGWLSPLDQTQLTLAEFLGAQGYATAGFAANVTYCARDSGLSRGFSHYQDYIFPQLSAFRMAVLVKRALGGLQAFVQLVEDRWKLVEVRPYVNDLWGRFVADRKGADVINHEALDWLTRRSQPERPFFAFLNYFDAHTPYQLPTGRMRRFAAEPIDNRQRLLIEQWGDVDKARVPGRDLSVVIDAYDDCVADLDEQLGVLLDELQRRGILQNTWLVITSDHGESFGEHDGVFCHGTSLYNTELHVPLLIVPPESVAINVSVHEPVSQRDLPATMVDVLGLGPPSPFPGDSLARFWNRAITPAAPPSPVEPVLSEVVPGDAQHRDSYGLPLKTWPLAALNDGTWTYIRQEGKAHEKLFNLHEDANEQRNLSRNPDALPTLEQMRTNLHQLTAGPLLPQRFNR